MEKEITDVESITTPVHWQWIKGDDSGNVVTFKEEGSQWITFNEGGRIATGLKDEFLKPIDADIAAEFVKTPISHDPLNASSQALSIPEPVAKVKSPIRILFDKQKKNTKIKLTLEFPVNIPAKGMYEIMSTSFDIDEVNNELKDFILDQLSTTDINSCLNQSVESLIESKYKGE
jgi:hypothetical protein